MSKMKQIDELTDKLVPQVLHKIYKIVDREMEYSDRLFYIFCVVLEELVFLLVHLFVLFLT